MTPRQRDLLRYVERYTEENDGVGPTVAEMQAALGLKSKSSVARIVDELVAQGRLARRPGRERSLIVVSSSVDWTAVSDLEVSAEYERRFGGVA